MSSPSSPSSTQPARGSIVRGLVAIALFTAGLWIGAWWMQNFTPRTGWLRLTLRSEYFHVAAHLLLYALLYALCRRLFARSRRPLAWAAALTLAIAVSQEWVQVLTYRGSALGRGELFDLAVDSVAIVACELFFFLRRRASGASTTP